MCKSSEDCYSHYHHYYLNDQPLINTSSSHDKSHDSSFLPANYPGEEISHYNPLRADFEIEPYNDAEKTLMEVMIDVPNGGETEREEERGEEEETLHMLMMNVIDSYWITMREREKRKSVIREHGLIDVYRILGRERLLSNEEQSVRVLMRRFARFLDSETNEKLIQSFLNEKRLIKRIKCLQTYRCLGIKTLAGGGLYERLREKRERTRERMKKSLDVITKNNKSIILTEQQKCYIVM